MLQHVLLDDRSMRTHMIEDSILKHPTEKVELTHRRLDPAIVTTAQLQSVSASERIKLLLGVYLELRSIAKIHVKMIHVRPSEELVVPFGIICDVPINQTQRDPRSARDVRKHFF